MAQRGSEEDSPPDESEPQLKYEPLGADVKSILARQRVTCLCLSEKILALGTEQGQVYVLDYSGNQVRHLDLHTARINDISFDKEGEHIATASADGSVVVFNLYTEQRTKYDFRKPVKTVAIDPRYASRKTKELVSATATGSVQLSTQGWLGRSDYPLTEPSSSAAAPAIYAARWTGLLVAWATDASVTVYDTTSHCRVRTVSRQDPPPRPAAGASSTAASAASARARATGAVAAASSQHQQQLPGRCSLLFANDSRLYIGWPDVVKVAKISSHENNIGTLTYSLEVVATLRFKDDLVLGVSPYGEDLAVLVYPSLRQQQQAAGATATGDQQQPASGSAESAGAEGAAGKPEAAPQAQTPTPAPSPSSATPDGPSAGQQRQPQEQQKPAGGSGNSDAGAAAAAAAAAAAPQFVSGRRPQLLILGLHDGAEQARDELPIPRPERYSPADYSLVASLPEPSSLHAAASAGAAAAAAGGSGNGARSSDAGAGAPPTAAAATASSGATSTQGAAAAARSGMASTSASAANLQAVGGTAAAGAAAVGGGPTPSASAANLQQGGSGASGAAATAAGASTVSSAPSTFAAEAGSNGRPAASSWADEARQETVFFIVAPQDIVMSRSRDAADRVAWMLERRRFEEALEVAEGAMGLGLPHSTYDRVVDAYIEELLGAQDYERAAALSPRLLKGDARRWERMAYLFAQVRLMAKLAPQLPTDKPRLRQQVYDMALQALLALPDDHATLLQLAQAWPAGCYSMPALVDAVAARMRRPGGETSVPLWQLLAWLYTRQGRPDLSLSIFLRLRQPSVFGFIQQHALQQHLLGRAPDLMMVDEAAAMALLTQHTDALPPANVVPSLQEAMARAAASGDDKGAEAWRRRLHRYLWGLFEVDANVAADYHELQVQLTAEYEPSRLMELLVSSQSYSLEGALAICEAKGLVSEQVYVLGRMGSADQALRLIIDRLGDIPQAIEFVVSQHDDDLWERLIEWALTSPETTGALLDHIGGHVDPLLLLRRIPRGMAIPSLRNRLRAIIADFRTQTSLREGCNVIMRSDCRHLLARLHAAAKRALGCVLVARPGCGGAPPQWYRYELASNRLTPLSAAEAPGEDAMQAAAPSAAAPLASSAATTHWGAHSQQGAAPAAGRDGGTGTAAVRPTSHSGAALAGAGGSSPYNVWVGFSAGPLMGQAQDRPGHGPSASREDAPSMASGATRGRRGTKPAGPRMAQQHALLPSLFRYMS